MEKREINVRRPLFDRLVDSEPRVDREVRPMRTLDRDGLKQSVRRELELLFNTRGSSPAQRPPDSERTVIDYGIPDLSEFSASNPDDRTRLADELRRAALIYEPRLFDVQVRVVPAIGREASLSASIEAVVLIEGVPEAVSFDVVMNVREGRVNVHVGA